MKLKINDIIKQYDNKLSEFNNEPSNYVLQIKIHISLRKKFIIYTYFVYLHVALIRFISSEFKK